MFTKLSTLSKILSVLALLGLVFALVGTPSVSAQSSAPTISTYSELPLKGQLIIPPGAEFVVPDEWHGLPVTIHRGMEDPSVSPVIAYGESIAKDRLDRYGPGPYETVIWDAVANPLPGFSGRTSCDTEFRGDGVALGKGTSIGDSGCFEMIEYDQSQQPVSAESLTAQNYEYAQNTPSSPADRSVPSPWIYDDSFFIPLFIIGLCGSIALVIVAAVAFTIGSRRKKKE